MILATERSCEGDGRIDEKSDKCGIEIIRGSINSAKLGQRLGKRPMNTLQQRIEA
jgi:hypothetical protein